MKRTLAAVLFCLLLATSAWAGFDEGWAAYNRGDYATALSEWRPLAEQGYVEAQSNLGLMYRQGRGVPQDYAEAVKWWRKVAEQGYVDAQYKLGVMYEKGRGIPYDYVEAVKWWRKAAEQGYVDAQYKLGVMYEKSYGVPHDYVRAHMWFDLAASQGHEISAKDRDIAAENMTPADISKAQRLAREWVEKHRGKK